MNPRMLAGALLLLSMFSTPLWQTVQNVRVIEGPCPNIPLAIACARNGNSIYYKPFTTGDPNMTDSGELFLVLAKEGTHIQQEQDGLRNTPATCMDLETPGHVAMGQAWSWLWYDNPPRTGQFSPIEQMAASDLTMPWFYASSSCAATWTPELLH